MANNFKTCDIALKLHPRSNVDLYHKYELKTFRYGVIPDADVYITGWSSLALLCSLKSNVMISTPLPSEIPKFFLNNFIQIDYNKPFSSMYYDTNVPSTLASFFTISQNSLASTVSSVIVNQLRSAN